MKTFKVGAVYLPHFIDEVYNTTRLHSPLGTLSPVMFENNTPGSRPNP